MVVVGGGSVGASTLYHLSSLGLKAVLLERDLLTSGTTWHSAGMLWRLRPSDVDIELQGYTRDLIKQLEVETEIDAWTENGGLFIASNEERMNEYKRLAETGRYFGVESHVLAPSEIAAVHPVIATDDVYAALYSPTDGTIDPTGVVNAYAKAARARGGRVFERESVASVETVAQGATRRRVTGVVTGSGHRIKTPWVVNACGAWANELAGMVGAKLPLLAMKHAMVVTEGIEGMHGGLPNVRDHDLSVYLKTQGDSMAIGGYEQNPEFWNDVDPAFAFGLFDLDWETFGQNLEGHLQRCPAIERVGIKSTVCGPESFTPDHKPLVGPQPGVRGFFNACGFNSMGMMLGGGIGREVAAWIHDGSPGVDMFAFDCARFHPSTVADPDWVFDRTHESYAKTYAVVFPHDEALAGRGARKSAVHDELERRGCVHQARHGFERPGWFLGDDQQEPQQQQQKEEEEEAGAAPASTATTTNCIQAPKPYDFYGAYEEGAWRLRADHPDVPPHADHPYLDIIEGELTFGWSASHALVAEECRAAREGVAIFDQSYFGKFFLEGPKADEAVQFLCGADMEGKAPNSVTYTPLCNASGGVEADLTVTKLGVGDGSGGGSGSGDMSSYYFAAGGNTMTKDWEWIARVLEERGFSDDDVQLRDASEDLTILSIQGPHCRELLRPLLNEAGVAAMNDDNDGTASGSFPFSTCREDLTIAGLPIAMCLRLTFVGELGYELHVASEHAAAVYRAIRERGEVYEAEVGVPVRDAGYRAIDSLSAEKNYRHWHADLSNRDTPLEAGIGFTVLSKLKRESTPATDFLGRQALEDHRARGLQRKLVCLTLPPSSPSAVGGGDEAGRAPLNGFETIWRDGICVGYVRSTAYGHTLGRTIAYGYVDCPEDLKKITNKWLSAGTWAIGDKGTMVDAELHLKAPFDPTNTRVKGEYNVAESTAMTAEAPSVAAAM